MKCFIAIVVVLAISTGVQALKCISGVADVTDLRKKLAGTVEVECEAGASSCKVETIYNEGENAYENTFHSCANSVKAACVIDSASKKNICYCDKDNCNDVTICHCAVTRYASIAENEEHAEAEAEAEAAKVEATKVWAEKALKCRTSETDTVGKACTNYQGQNYSCIAWNYDDTTYYGCDNPGTGCVKKSIASTCYCNKDNCNDVTKCDCAITRSASVATNKEYAEAEAEAAKVETERAAAAKIEENAEAEAEAKAKAEAAKVETEKASSAKLEAEKSGAQAIKAATTATAVAAVALWLL
jgi:hypothetical protein